MNYDIIIIGGGASGMCTAITAKTEHNRILIIDKDSRPGRKILSTGNGRCNLTNEYCEVSLFNSNPEGLYPYFSGGSHDFIEEVIGAFNWRGTLDFFSRLNVFTINKNGYIYPRTEQASCILECLEAEIRKRGIDVLPSEKIYTVEEKGGYFIINSKYKAARLVISCGGLSSAGNNADGLGYKIAESFGHTVIKPRPALCGIPCKGRIFRDISGVRQDGLIVLYDENSGYSLQCRGNIQFTDYGISGIPAFQLSSEAGRLLAEGAEPLIKIDMFPEISEKKLAQIMKSRDENFLCAIVNSKLAGAYEKIALNEGLKRGSSPYINRLAGLVKHFHAKPEALPSFKNSQVTAGGVSTDEIDARTMESKKKKGLYFTGEIIDVNGICGGYNLQWAWSTGFICAQALRGCHDKN